MKKNPRPAKKPGGAAAAAPAAAAPLADPEFPNEAQYQECGKPPLGYNRCSTHTLHVTMAGRENIVWECYTPEQNRRPVSRRHVWQVGTIPGAGKYDLHDVGAQHRVKFLWLRVCCDDANARVLELTAAGSVVPKQANGFYLIRPSNPHKNPKTGLIEFDHLYQLEFAAAECRLEVFYDLYPPGLKAQLEDGGPPPNPPVGMEN